MGMIPPLSATGLYRVSAPFDSVLLSNRSYTCMAIRRLSDFIGLGVDPYDTYYKPLNIDEAKYKTDYANNECIISLQSTDGSWVYVPSSYILSYPELNGIPYSRVGLFADLGALPDSLDLTYAKAKVADVLAALLGIPVSVSTVVTSARTLISQNDHLTAEATRLQNVTQNDTDYSEVFRLQNEIEMLRARNMQLEAYIAQNHLP